MRILVDSNVLLRLAQPAHPQHKEATYAAAVLIGRPDELVLVPQCIYEFWVVATRPIPVNGLGYTVLQAEADIVRLFGPFTILPELPAIFSEWHRLVLSHSVLGKNAHDARLVAAMIVHGVTHLLTFNEQDFRRFTNITVLTPAAVLAPPAPAGP